MLIQAKRHMNCLIQVFDFLHFWFNLVYFWILTLKLKLTKRFVRLGLAGMSYVETLWRWYVYGLWNYAIVYCNFTWFVYSINCSMIWITSWLMMNLSIRRTCWWLVNIIIWKESPFNLLWVLRGWPMLLNYKEVICWLFIFFSSLKTFRICLKELFFVLIVTALKCKFTWAS